MSKNRIFSVINTSAADWSNKIAPWELNYNPYTLQEANEPSSRLIRLNANPSLRFYTPYEGQRYEITDPRKNPITKLNGIVVSFDNDFSHREVSARVAELAAKGETYGLPSYIQMCFNGKGYRAIWLFKDTLNVDFEGVSSKVRLGDLICSLAKRLKVHSFLPGIDTIQLRSAYVLYGSRGLWAEDGGFLVDLCAIPGMGDLLAMSFVEDIG